MNTEQIDAVARSALSAMSRPLSRGAVLSMLGELGLSQADAVAVVGYALERGLLRLRPDGALTTRAPRDREGPILVVEDDVDVQRSVRQVLEEEGYTISSAANGKEALRRLAKGERPSLILLDLIMPVMDGWDLLEILHEDEELSKIPVVVLSAVADRTQDLGAPVLRKPVDLGALVNVVAEARAA